MIRGDGIGGVPVRLTERSSRCGPYGEDAMILVTGATGNVGGDVVAELVEAGHDVRALTRHPERATLPPGAEVVRGDLSAPETLPAALAGVEAVFLYAVPGSAPA